MPSATIAKCMLLLQTCLYNIRIFGREADFPIEQEAHAMKNMSMASETKDISVQVTPGRFSKLPN
jgi:hypothetical protein